MVGRRTKNGVLVIRIRYLLELIKKDTIVDSSVPCIIREDLKLIFEYKLYLRVTLFSIDPHVLIRDFLFTVFCYFLDV